MSRFLDLTGQRFGRLVVVKRAENIGVRVAFLCQCDCGRSIITLAQSLRDNRTSSCGCLRKEISGDRYVYSSRMRKRLDFTGLTFGRLVVIEPIGRTKSRNVLWRCICICGEEVTASQGSLASGNVQSCGCLQKDRAAETQRTHGLSYDVFGKTTKLYRVWSNMRNRCQNQNNINFSSYGGRGITVCQEWEDYAVFHVWAMTNGYRDGLTIDRRDNNGNYKPDNCRFVDRKMQTNNRRNTINLCINGETKTLEEWAKESNLKYTTIWYRLDHGWPIEKVLATPILGEKQEAMIQ